jgi:hypothetical protein
LDTTFGDQDHGFDGEQLTRPKLELTEKVLPDAVYCEQPMPSMQKVWVPQSTEKELESKSKAQPVFEVAARTNVSILPLTVQLSLALLQIGQAYVCVGPDPPLAPSLSTMPPHAAESTRRPNPEIRRTTLET